MPKTYLHLSMDERRKIYRLQEQKTSVDEMAAVLRRYRSTIYRELQRNTWWESSTIE